MVDCCCARERAQNSRSKLCDRSRRRESKQPLRRASKSSRRGSSLEKTVRWCWDEVKLWSWTERAVVCGCSGDQQRLKVCCLSIFGCFVVGRTNTKSVLKQRTATCQLAELGTHLLMDLGLEQSKGRPSTLCVKSSSIHNEFSRAALCLVGGCMGDWGFGSPRDRGDPRGVFALSCLAFCSTPLSCREASTDPWHRLGTLRYRQTWQAGKSTGFMGVSIGISNLNSMFSIAMFDYQRVINYSIPKCSDIFRRDWSPKTIGLRDFLGDWSLSWAHQDPEEVGGEEAGDEWEDPFLCCASEPDFGEDAHARSTLQGCTAGGEKGLFRGMSWNPKETQRTGGKGGTPEFPKRWGLIFIAIQGRGARYILCPYRSRPF